MKNIKRVILLFFILIALSIVCFGASYSFFSYIKEGNKENSIKLGSITFLYTEVSGVGNGITISDAFPMSDSEGKAQMGEGKVFDFKVESTLSRSDLEYEVVAEVTEESTLPLDAIKFYLTDITDGIEKAINTTIDSDGVVKTLEQYSDTLIENASGKTIYQETILRNTKGYVKQFRARMWIREDIDWADESYMEKTATIRINVYANSNRNMASTGAITPQDTSIERVTGNRKYLFTETTSEEYQYTLTVPNEVDSIDIEVIPKNMESTVEVTEISNTGSYGLQTGENYFKAQVISEDKSKSQEYILRVIREKSGNTDLFSLGVIGYSLTPTFASETTSYHLTVEASSVEITATATSSVAMVSGTGTKMLDWGNNTANVIVTAQDGTIKTYVITITNTRPTAPTITGGSSSWVSTVPTISVSTSGSAISGVKHYEYYKSTTNTAPSDSTVATGTTTGNLTVSDEGTSYIWYRTVSNNGFKSVWTGAQVVNLDTTVPEMDIRLSANGDKVYANIYIDDELSGINKISNSNNESKTLPSTLENAKILVISNSSLSYDYPTILYKYNNVDVTYSLDVENIISSDYDLVIYSMAVWNVPEEVNKLFDAGINLITIGNDSNDTLSIIKQSLNKKDTLSNVNPIENSILTKKLDMYNTGYLDTQAFIYFNDDVDVWYQGSDSTGVIYDVIGYYTEHGTQWIHSNLGFRLENVRLLYLTDYIFKENGAQYEITTSGNYTFYGYDVAGNVIEKTVYIDITAPTTPIFSNKVVTSDTVTLTYNSIDNESEIISVKCYYGDSEDTITAEGMENSGMCIFPSTASYAKVCVKNVIGLESCSANKQLTTTE